MPFLYPAHPLSPLDNHIQKKEKSYYLFILYNRKPRLTTDSSLSGDRRAGYYFRTTNTKRVRVRGGGLSFKSESLASPRAAPYIPGCWYARKDLQNIQKAASCKKKPGYRNHMWSQQRDDQTERENC